MIGYGLRPEFFDVSGDCLTGLGVERKELGTRWSASSFANEDSFVLRQIACLVHVISPLE